jgi:hypothetical protein
MRRFRVGAVEDDFPGDEGQSERDRKRPLRNKSSLIMMVHEVQAVTLPIARDRRRDRGCLSMIRVSPCFSCRSWLAQEKAASQTTTAAATIPAPVLLTNYFPFRPMLSSITMIS